MCFVTRTPRRAMEKSEFLKARVSEKLKAEFEDICRTYDKQPTVKLRELVYEFVRAERHRLGDRVLIDIYKPDHYDIGAWRVTIKLRDREALIWNGQPVPFEFPELPERSLVCEREYAAVIVKEGGDCRLGGKFVDGTWKGDLYSNGCLETENPTPVELVRSELLRVVTERVDQFGQNR